MAVLRKNAEFSSWEEFHSALSDYEKTKFVAFVVDKSVTIENRNRKIEQANRDRPPDKQEPLFDKALQYQNVTLVCKHGGKKHIGNGRGIRPIQS